MRLTGERGDKDMDSELEQIYALYSRKVYLYLLSLCHSHALAEDLTQETFLKASAHISQFRHESSLSSWLCSIAKNLYRDSCRRQKLDFELGETLLVSEDGNRDLRIFSCLHHLDEPYREVVYLRIFCSMSYKQIGEIFSRSEAWGRVTFYRGKQQLLRLWLKEKGEE